LRKRTPTKTALSSKPKKKKNNTQPQPPKPPPPPQKKKKKKKEKLHPESSRREAYDKERPWQKGKVFLSVKRRRGGKKTKQTKKKREKCCGGERLHGQRNLPLPKGKNIYEGETIRFPLWPPPSMLPHHATAAYPKTVKRRDENRHLGKSSS